MYVNTLCMCCNILKLHIDMEVRNTILLLVILTSYCEHLLLHFVM